MRAGGIDTAHHLDDHVDGAIAEDGLGIGGEARAIELDSSLAVTYQRRGRLYALQGEIDRAVMDAERAQQLEPLWLGPRAAAGSFLYYAKRYDESIRLVEQVLALDERADVARSVLIRDLIGKGDYERALREIGKREIEAPGSNACRAQALALSGRRKEALAELDRVLKLSRERYVSAYDIALIYAALADTDNVFRWLEHAMEDRSTLVTFLAQDPMFDALHADPRFVSLVQRIGIYHRALRPAPTPTA